MKSSLKPGVTVGLFGILGVVLAMIESALYDAGYGVNVLANIDATIVELMILTVVVFFLLGSVIAVAKS